MNTALVNGRVVLPDGLRCDRCVSIEGGSIAAVSAAPPPRATIVDLEGALLMPGFIDVQVNGGGGLLFNDAPSVETIAAIGAAHRRHGTTGFLPTLISDELERVDQAMRAVDAAIAAGVPGVLGIHLEGPFLAPERRGIHRADKLRRLSDADIGMLTAPRRGVTLVTLAPEAASPAQIARLVDAGVIVALGHSGADYETARAAFAAGARGVTHLFNAMTGLGHRAPGMVGAVLEDGSLYAGVIADGEHLHPAALRIALAAKGAERIMLVTDAMPCAGSDADGFDLQGRAIRRAGERLVDAGGTLAGSTLTMDRAFANLRAWCEASETQASRMASGTAAEFLGLPRLGAIAPGMQADLVAIDASGSVTATWIAGAEERYR